MRAHEGSVRSSPRGSAGRGTPPCPPKTCILTLPLRAPRPTLTLVLDTELWAVGGLPASQDALHLASLGCTQAGWEDGQGTKGGGGGLMAGLRRG